MEISDRIENALVRCRPYLQADGGDITFLRYKPESGIVELKWEGTCLICPMSILTLRAGIERTLMMAVPEVKRVEAVAA